MSDDKNNPKDKWNLKIKKDKFFLNLRKFVILI